MPRTDFNALLDAAGYVECAISMDEIRLAPGTAEVWLTVRDVEGLDLDDLHIQLTVSGLRDLHLAPTNDLGYPRVEDAHPLLWPYTEPSGELYTKGRPSAFKEAAFDLFSVHQAVYGTACAFDARILNVLQTGYGKLDAGPAPLLERYARVLDAHGVNTSLLVHPRQPDGPGARILLFGTSYFIGDAFRFQRLDAAARPDAA